MAFKKKHYRSTLLYKIENCNSSSHFWQAVRGTSTNHSNVDLPTWQKYLYDNYPNPVVVAMSTSLPRVSHPILDGAITTDEILLSLAHCKNGKAPGVDGIGYEFYKNFLQNWILYMQYFFNLILTTETIP